MNNLYLGKRDLFIPSTPNELTGEQLIRCLRIAGLPLPAPALRRLFLFVLLPTRASRLCLRWLWAGPTERPRLTELRWLSRLLWPRLLDADDRLTMLHLTDWLFTDEKPLTRQLLPVLRAGTRTFVGPTEQCRSLTYAQFYNAEAFYLLYLQSKKAEHLDALAAVLYLPAGQAWRHEEDFTHETRTLTLAALDLAQKLAIFQFYHGCRAYIVEKFKAVFPKPTEQELLEQKTPQRGPKAVRDFWRVKVRSQLAGGFVNLVAVDAAPVYQVLDQLNHLILEAKAADRRQRLQELANKTAKR